MKKEKKSIKSNEELILLYKMNNDINARNELIINNIGLVYTAARKKVNLHTSFTFEDLIQEGIIGMIKGIEKFDISKNTNFSTYVYYWISQQISRAIMNDGYLIRLPAHIYEKMNQVSKEENSYLKYDSDISSKILCEKINITEREYEHINFYKTYYYNPVSLNTVIHIDSDDIFIELQDFIPDKKITIEEIILNKHLKEDIYEILNSLSLREREVLKLRFGLKGEKPMTLEAIGRKFNLTRERIRQIEENALKKIRKSSQNERLKEYLNYI